MKSLVIDQYHYIEGGNGLEELYDLNQDPREKHDLARSEVGSQVIKRFRAILAGILVRK